MTPQEEGPEPREYLRLPAMIPVRIGIIHAWQGSGLSSLLGSMSNVSRGGAEIHVRWAIPPRTELRISLPVSALGQRLLAEVVWTSASPGSNPASAVYGVRWKERLSQELLDTILLRQTGSAPDETGAIPRT